MGRGAMPLSMPPNASSSALSLTASSTSGRCNVRVILLNKEELQISIENKNIKVGDLFSKSCEHVGLKETQYFGLAQKKDGEFQFLQLDTKLQKLASKLWKSKNLLNNDKPQLTFYLRVMHYVDNIGLLRDRITRQQYYLQLRENLLSYGQAVCEEKCFILAAYALQADFGPYKPDQHVGTYFDPREYFPAWVVMRRGQDYITSNLPVMHKDMAAMTQGDARVAFIRELSCPPICHNFHFYQLRRRKYDSAATIWLAICPRGLEIHEEVKEFKNLLSVYHWQNIEKLHHDKKKFEIVTDSIAERRFSYYVTGKEWGEHLLTLCRSSHSFQMSLQPRLLEMQYHEVQDQRFREMYVHVENAGRGSQEHRWQMPVSENVLSSPSSVTVQSLASGGCGGGLSTVLENAVSKTPTAKGNDVEEIMIVSPPLMSSTLTTISPMSDLPQSSVWSSPCELQTPSGHNSGRNFRRLPSSGHQGALRCAGSFIKHNLGSSSKPNSSVESLMAYTLSNSNNSSVGRTQASLSSSPSSPMKRGGSGARDDAKSWMASSVNSTPSWRSASPNSSTGSGQLVFSLPPKQTLVDAASLRKSLPHGTTLNEYISRIFSGEEMQFVSSGFRKPRHRKSSLDQQQLCLSFATGDLISRSTSLRQPNELRPKIEKQGALAPAGVDGTKSSQETRTACLLPVQSLPQMPVLAQVQRIIFPEKMTAISTSVHPQGRAFGEPLLGTIGGHSVSTYSPEKSSGNIVHPLHSTPIPSRYQLHPVHISSLPISYETPVNMHYEMPVNSQSSGFDTSLTVPNFAFPMTPVITATEGDYRGKLANSVLDYTRPVVPGLSVFGQAVVSTGAQPFFLTSSQAPVAQEPMSRSDPPAYHEWQAAAKAMAVLGTRQPTTEPTDKYSSALVQNRLLDKQTTANENFLLLSSYLNASLQNVPEFNTANRTPVDVTYDIGKGAGNQGDGAGVGRLSDHLLEKNMKSDSTSEDQNLQSTVAMKQCTDFSACQLDISDARMNIREKLRNFGPSDLPMLKGLLTDKSLLNYQSQSNGQVVEPHRSKAAAHRPVSWHHEHQHLRRNGELSISCLDGPGHLTDRNVKPVSNGDLLKMTGPSGKVSVDEKVNSRRQMNGLRQHLSDVVKSSSSVSVVNHSQSHSDSAALSCCPVTSEC